MKDSDYKRVPIEKIKAIPGTGGRHRLRKNSWYLVDKDGNALLYKGKFPQCNTNKEVNDKLLENKDHPGVKNIFIENAWNF